MATAVKQRRPERRVFSSGALENVSLSVVRGTLAKRALINIHNNDAVKTATVTVRVFRLSGTKLTVFTNTQVKVEPSSQASVTSDVSNTLYYEVQIQVEGTTQVLLSSFGKGETELVAAQRVLNSEFTRIERLTRVPP
jgi:hypothetical protein